ncbi:MAG: DUF2000 domain-containing protein, partial [Deinococcota bacterium]
LFQVLNAIPLGNFYTWSSYPSHSLTLSCLLSGAVLVGEPYADADDIHYLPMIVQPIMVFEASTSQLRNAYNRALSREISFSIYTEELFSTPNDIENRAAVKAVKSDELKLVGLAFQAERKIVDKIVKGIKLHS